MALIDCPKGHRVPTETRVRKATGRGFMCLWVSASYLLKTIDAVRNRNGCQSCSSVNLESGALPTLSGFDFGRIEMKIGENPCLGLFLLVGVKGSPDAKKNLQRFVMPRRLAPVM